MVNEDPSTHGRGVIVSNITDKLITQAILPTENIFTEFDDKNIKIFKQKPTKKTPQHSTANAKSKAIISKNQPLAPSQIVHLSDLERELTRIENSAFAFQLPTFNRAKKMVGSIIRSLHVDKNIMNKVSMVRESDPICFDHSVLTAFMLTEIGMARGLEFSDLIDVFCAGLFHNIGNLYIDKSLLQKNILTLNEKKLIEGHPVVSYQLLKTSQCFSEKTLTMVLNHHEFLDGSGYPRKLKIYQLDDNSRLINIISCYCALLHKGRSATDAVKLIEIYTRKADCNGYELQPKYDPGFVKLLKKLVLVNTTGSDAPASSEAGKLMSVVQRYLPEIIFSLNHIDKNINQLLKTQKTPPLVVIKNNINHIIQAIHRSGLSMIHDCTIEELSSQVLPDTQLLLPDLFQYMNQIDKAINTVKINQHSTLVDIAKRYIDITRGLQVIAKSCLDPRRLFYLY